MKVIVTWHIERRLQHGPLTTLRRRRRRRRKKRRRRKRKKKKTLSFLFYLTP